MPYGLSAIDGAVQQRDNAWQELMDERGELRALRDELTSECGCREASKTKVSDLQAQVHRLQASSSVTAELAEALTRLTEYARENDDLLDREATALKASVGLRHQVGELYMERSQLVTEVTG